MSEPKDDTRNSGEMRCSSRYEVANHPFDRGYFDAIEGRAKHGSDWDEYEKGWRTAKAELRSERSEELNSLMDEHRKRKRDSATEGVRDDVDKRAFQD